MPSTRLGAHVGYKFQRTGYGRGLIAPTFNFGTPALSRKLLELGSSNLVR